MRRRGETQGRLVRWASGAEATTWATDPDAFDPHAVESTLCRVGRLFGPGRYFGLEVSGWENVPAAPAMLVSNHSGGTTIPDVWGFLVAWYRRFGAHRPVHPMAHEIVLATRATARYFARRGVLRASPDLAARVLSTFRRDLLVMPGGDLDTWRPYSRRFEVQFGGRTGYARLALRMRVPIVPIANAGAHETLLVLTDGQPIARALRLPELTRARIFPVHLSFPWGLAIGPWPHLPTPARLRYRIGAPIPPEGAVPGEEPSDELVAEHDARVRRAVQGLLHELRDERAR